MVSDPFAVETIFFLPEGVTSGPDILGDLVLIVNEIYSGCLAPRGGERRREDTLLYKK